MDAVGSAARAIKVGREADLIVPGGVESMSRAPYVMNKLSKLKALFRVNGTVTAGNASGVNDGSCALLLASEEATRRQGIEPRARIVAMATAGVEPRIIGMGPVPATRKVLEIAGLTLNQVDVIEHNEAFAAQGLAVWAWPTMRAM